MVRGRAISLGTQHRSLSGEYRHAVARSVRRTTLLTGEVMDRRHFCIASAASVVCLGAEQGVSAAERPTGPAIALDQVLFDSRHPGSGAFGTAAARAGWRAIAFPGDVSAMWRETL